MNTTLVLILVAVVVLCIPLLLVVGIYNALVTLRNRFKNAFSQIDVQLKRRHDLIPNLVETAKGYLKHERETLEAVIQARNAAVSARQSLGGNAADAGGMTALVGAEAALTGTLGRLFALQEGYPDLKADRTMNQLMEELTSTENKVAFARQAYNDSVMSYNTKRETFPNNLVAGMLGFQEASSFEIEDAGERLAPKVDLHS